MAACLGRMRCLGILCCLARGRRCPAVAWDACSGVEAFPGPVPCLFGSLGAAVTRYVWVGPAAQVPQVARKPDLVPLSARPALPAGCRGLAPSCGWDTRLRDARAQAQERYGAVHACRTAAPVRQSLKSTPPSSNSCTRSVCVQRRAGPSAGSAWGCLLCMLPAHPLQRGHDYWAE